MKTEPMPAIHISQAATGEGASRDRMLKGPVHVAPQWKELQNQLRGRLELQKVRVRKPVWESSWPRVGGGHGARWGIRTQSQRIAFLEKEKGSWEGDSLTVAEAMGRVPLASLIRERVQLCQQPPTHHFPSHTALASAPCSVLPPTRNLCSPPLSWPRSCQKRRRAPPIS